jgi:hypothetical protein
MTNKTVLVLGAGASKEYGFPTGIELRKKILKLQDDLDFISVITQNNKGFLRKFFDAFKYSQAKSIDLFLGKNPDYEEIGKKLIAIVLFSSENRVALFSEDIEDDWYSYLVHKISYPSWEDFDPSWLKIINFNYDRSLETYLLETLVNYYGKTEGQVQEKLKSLEVIHVYGKLIYPTLSYGNEAFNGNYMDDAYTDPLTHLLNSSIKGLKIIPEGRGDEDHLLRIKEIISNSARVGFLGFSFDETNVSRISTDGAYGTPESPKFIAASTLNLTKKEIEKIKMMLLKRNPILMDNFFTFSPVKCEQILRESLLLD